ncbi:asparagine synthetase domain protein, partial [Vibrio cholerae HC-78A1]
MSVPNEVLLYIVSKKAADDGIKVLLSGEGADE